MPTESDNSIIDKCLTYITEKDCYYLAKEGVIVQYMSTTGRKADYMWHKHSIAETIRIVRATRLTTAESQDFKEHHLISAFQELVRVYEFGVKSRHTTARGIFNYYTHAEMSLGDEAVSMLVEALQLAGLTAILMPDVINIISSIDEKLRLKISVNDQRELMCKHFETAGFVLKTGANRPLIDGRKQTAIMMPNTKPKEVVGISKELTNKLISKIYGELV